MGATSSIPLTHSIHRGQVHTVCDVVARLFRKMHYYDSEPLVPHDFVIHLNINFFSSCLFIGILFSKEYSIIIKQSFLQITLSKTGFPLPG